MTNWMIYGATGYSGKLIAEEALSCGQKPILAGRSREKLANLGEQLGCEVRVFELNDAAALKKGLEGIQLVIHAAGPFSQTAKPMLQACLEQGCHYLDITGEMDIFEMAHSAEINARASAQKIVVCPGVGFDVVPTDCVALSLKNALPDATHLSLGFASKGKLSPGTAKTMLEGATKGTRNRRDGRIQSCPLQTPTIDFGSGPLPAMSLAWGDISTAYHSTGIPNIDVFIATTPQMIKKAKRMRWFRPILGLNFVQRRLKAKIEKTVKGPSLAERARSATLVWGEVANAAGAKRVAHLTTTNGYTLTAQAPVAIVNHWLKHGFERFGSLTPALLMGPDFVSQLPGCSPIKISDPDQNPKA